MKKDLVENILGELGVTVIYHLDYDDSKLYSVSFNAYEIVGIDDNGPVYTMSGASSSMDTTSKPTEAENYFNGYIKWDKCSHFYFGDKEGYLHICGQKNFKQLVESINIILDRSIELIKETGTYVLD